MFDVFDARLQQKLAVIHNADVLSDLLHFLQLMRGKENGAPSDAGVLGQDAHELIYGNWVERGRRLIENQQIRALSQRQQQLDFGLVAVGELFEALLHGDFEQPGVLFDGRVRPGGIKATADSH